MPRKSFDISSGDWIRSAHEKLASGSMTIRNHPGVPIPLRAKIGQWLNFTYGESSRLSIDSKIAEVERFLHLFQEPASMRYPHFEPAFQIHTRMFNTTPHSFVEQLEYREFPIEAAEFMFRYPGIIPRPDILERIAERVLLVREDYLKTGVRPYTKTLAVKRLRRYHDNQLVHVSTVHTNKDPAKRIFTALQRAEELLLAELDLSDARKQGGHNA